MEPVGQVDWEDLCGRDCGQLPIRRRWANGYLRRDQIVLRDLAGDGKFCGGPSRDMKREETEALTAVQGRERNKGANSELNY